MQLFSKLTNRTFFKRALLPMMALFMSLGAVGTVSVTEASAASAYQQGLKVGKKTGYSHGYNDGYKYGYKRGYRDELNRPRNSFSTSQNRNSFDWAAYVRGYKAGYRIGYENGYPVGKSEGRTDGRDQAKDFKEELRDQMRERCRGGYCE
ncbi:hypothetical protein NBRC116602_00620 [Hyphomicrobiales bacterium 4NK60-0047b]|jgi:flagellar biosynthesis/type III secretory pathway protein FliH